MLYLYLAVGALLIIVGIVLFVCLVRHCARQHRKHIDDGHTRDIMLNESIQPNGMTTTLKPLATMNRRDPSFSGSDLVIIQQTLQMMKQKYPPEIYDQVHNNTTKLVGGNLTESDKVLTIGEIIRNLVECENTRDDFVAFTDILYNHLDSTDNHAGQPVVAVAPPIYFEPTVRHGEETEPFQSNDNGYALPGPTSVTPSGEHIYAEPIHLQQPLLRNEYTVPIDRHDSVSNLYTEPIARAIGEDLFCRKCSTLMNSVNRKCALDAMQAETCSCQAQLDDLYSNFIYSKWSAFFALKRLKTHTRKRINRFFSFFLCFSLWIRRRSMVIAATAENCYRTSSRKLFDRTKWAKFNAFICTTVHIQALQFECASIADIFQRER